jgi:hypothetical protein
MELSTIHALSRSASLDVAERLSLGEQVTQEELDGLVNYLGQLRVKTAKPKDAWRWAGLAALVKYQSLERDCLRYVQVKDGTALVSDGHRAHLAQTDRADGVYTVQGEPENFFGKLIDIRAVLPKRLDQERTTVLIDSLPIHRSHGQTVYAIADKFFQVQYVADAAARQAHLHYAIVDGRLVASHEFGTAVVMPFAAR